MKIRTTALGLSLALLLNAPCFADTSTDMKFTVDYNAIKFKDTEVNISPAALSFGVDYTMNNHFSIIGKYGVGISDDSQTTILGDASFDVDYLYSVFVKGSLMEGSDFRPYALVGFSRAKLTGSIGNFDFGQSDTGFSYGIGADYHINESLRLNVDYSQLIDYSNVDMTSVNLGLGFSF